MVNLPLPSCIHIQISMKKSRSPNASPQYTRSRVLSGIRAKTVSFCNSRAVRLVPRGALLSGIKKRTRRQSKRRRRAGRRKRGRSGLVRRAESNSLYIRAANRINDLTCDGRSLRAITLADRPALSLSLHCLSQYL